MTTHETVTSLKSCSTPAPVPHFWTSVPSLYHVVYTLFIHTPPHLRRFFCPPPCPPTVSSLRNPSQCRLIPCHLIRMLPIPMPLHPMPYPPHAISSPRHLFPSHLISQITNHLPSTQPYQTSGLEITHAFLLFFRLYIYMYDAELASILVCCPLYEVRASVG